MKEYLLLLTFLFSARILVNAQTNLLNIKTIGMLIDYEVKDASALLQLNSVATALENVLNRIATLKNKAEGPENKVNNKRL